MRRSVSTGIGAPSVLLAGVAPKEGAVSARILFICKHQQWVLIHSQGVPQVTTILMRLGDHRYRYNVSSDGLHAVAPWKAFWV